MRKPDGAVGVGPHKTKTHKRIPWPVCVGCGLVYLKNEATRKRLREGYWIFEDEVRK
jgi:hypothetical protein